MFTALYFKEWREKALVFVFELGLLALLLGAQFFVQNKDLREWLVYAVLLLFFPFAALLLGRGRLRSGIPAGGLGLSLFPPREPDRRSGWRSSAPS